jgi:bzd-type benzoyl-CoA reductase N subunit
VNGNDAMPTIDLFRNISDDPKQYALKWKNEIGGKIIGHFCSYTPIEIIIASGALPFRIFNNSADSSFADSHLQSYCCSVVRGALNDALSGQLDFLDAAVFPHTCDSIQRLSDIWRLNMPKQYHADIILPVKLNTDSSREYMVAVLNKFRKDIEHGVGVEITDRALKDAIAISNRNRKNLGKLYRIKQDNPNSISARDIYSVFKAAMVMDSKTLAHELDALIAELATHENAGDSPGKRVVLSGGLCHVPDITQLVERSGGFVVWDDFCSGTRYFQGFIDPEGDPIESIAKRYSERIVCPAKHSGLKSRGDYLIEAVGKAKAKGVVFILQKFCDPHAFDYPYLKEMLDEKAIPSILIEIENQGSTSGQLGTRIEAFIETL